MANKNTVRKRKKRGIPTSAVAFIALIALLFGLTIGIIINNFIVRGAEKRRDEPITSASPTIEATAAPTAEPTADPEAKSALANDGEGANSGVLYGDESLTPNDEAQPDETAAPVESVVVAEFEGGKVMNTEVLDAYNSVLSAYLFTGYSADDIASDLIEEVVVSEVRDRVARIHAAELGLDTPTEAELSEIDAQAQKDFDEIVSYFIDDISEDGMTDEQAYEETVNYLALNEATTLESVKQGLLDEIWEEKLYDYVTKDVVVTEADIDEIYKTYLEEQTESYSASSEDYEFARYSDEVVVYNPEGFRLIKYIKLGFDDDAQLEYDEITEQIDALEADSDELPALRERLAALYAGLQAEADALTQRIEAGEDFDVLIKEFNDDIELDEEDMTRGVYVCANSALWPDEFTSACMELENPGDVSDPMQMLEGVYVFKYIEDVKPGAVALEDIHDRIEADTLDSLRFEAYDAQLNEWLEEAKPVYHLELMQ